MSFALGLAGSVTVIAPEVVFTKYPLPLTPVNEAVLGVVSQSTVPVLPKPVCDAPDAKEIVSPLAPSVMVVPHLLTMLESDWFVMLSTFILLVIIIEICTLLLLYLNLQRQLQFMNLVLLHHHRQ